MVRSEKLVFGGLTHPEAIAAGRQRILEPMSEKLWKFGVSQAPICWQADLLWFASLMTGRLPVRGAVLFCGLTHPEAIAAGRQRFLEPMSEKLWKFGVSQAPICWQADLLWFASLMTGRLTVRGAVLFCGLTHPEAIAAGRQRILEPMSEKLWKFGMSQAPICWQADLLWFASLMTGRLTVRGAMLFCGLTHPEAIAAGRQRILEPMSEKLWKFGVSQAPICWQADLLWFASLMTGRLTVRGAMLFCGLTHPEAIAAGRQRFLEPMSEKLWKFGVSQAPICWQADLLWFASLMTGRLTVRGAVLFCGLTHPEAIAAGRQRILEPLSEKLWKFGVSQAPICWQADLLWFASLMTGRLTVRGAMLFCGLTHPEAIAAGRQRILEPMSEKLWKFGVSQAPICWQADLLWFAPLMTGRLTVRGAVLFCGLTHPEAIAAGRQRILEPLSEKLWKFGVSQAPICWQADLLWFASLMTGRLTVRGAMLFCGLTHPEAIAAGRQRILEPMSEKLTKFGVSQAPICWQADLLLFASLMTGRLTVRGAMLFCGLTHPEAIAAGRQRILEPLSEKLWKFGVSQAPICWQADLLWFASLMTGRLTVRGAMLFCGLTHPEAIAAGRQRILEPLSEKLWKFGVSQAPICWQADLLWFASLMTGRLTVRGAMLFCGLTHPEAIAAGRQRILEPLSEKLWKFGVSQAPICWQADLLWFASLMTGRLTVRGAMLFCGLTHPEAIAAGRQRESLSQCLRS